jgi:hypothetical protein
MYDIRFAEYESLYRISLGNQSQFAIKRNQSLAAGSLAPNGIG